MIVQPNIKHSAEVIAELQLGNIEVCAIPGTPLFNIINEVASLSGLLTPDIDGALTVEQAIAQVSLILNEGGDFKDMLEEMVISSANKVKTNIQVAQQEVMPLVRAVVEDVERAIAERVDSISLNMSVKPSTALQLWSSGKIQTYLPSRDESYAGVDTQSPSCFVARPAELFELVKTGAPSLDAEIQEWLEALNDSQCVLDAAWKGVFAHGQATEMSRYILTRLDNNEKMAVFLIANNLLARDPGDIVDLVDDISLRDLQTSLTLAKRIAGLGLQAIFDRADIAVANKLLILSAPTAEELEDVRKGGDSQIDILVSGPVYEAFLAQGGTPDAIIGAVLHTGPFAKFDQIIESQQMYEGIAERTAIIVRETAIAKKVSVVVDQLRKSIYGHVESIVEDRSAYIARCAEIGPCVEQALVNVNSDCLRDVHNLVTDIICKVFYDETYDVRIVIENINRHGRNAPGVSIRELATLATYDYVARYLVGQLVARKAT